MLNKYKSQFQLLLILPCVATFAGCATIFGTTYSEENAEYSYDEMSDLEDRELAATSSEFNPEPAVPDQSSIRFPDESNRRLLKPLGPPEFSTERSPETAAAMFAQPAVTAESGDSTTDENPFAALAREQEIHQTAFAPGSGNTSTNSASTFRAAEQRMPTAQDNCSPNEFVVGASPLVSAYPDEYIFDGGDRNHPAHYYGGELSGIDTEDTIVEFTDNKGENHVKATNRVAVYAPRFGSIRTIAGPDVGLKVDKAAGATDVSGFDSLDELRGIDATVMNTPASGVATREGASGVEIAQPAYMSEKTDSVVMNRQFNQGFEAKVSMGPGILEMSSMQEVKLQILEVASSNMKTGFGQTAATTQATQAYATFRAQATVGMEDNGRKGEIHITKEASPLIARPGDVITFTIQFRNIGDYNVHDVRIIDNLTPRLVYVPGTGQISAPDNAGGALSVVPNKEGSQMLEFRLDQPLQGGGSGSITFQARVR